MPTLADALTAALAHHQAGRLQEAEHLYRQVVAAVPDCAEAWHLLGAIAYLIMRRRRGGGGGPAPDAV